jgi:hypothetical protein
MTKKIERCDMDNFWAPIAQDVLLTLAKVTLSGRQRSILDVIFLKTYGQHDYSKQKKLRVKNRKTEVAITLEEYAEITGIGKSNVSSLLKQIIALNIIKRSSKRPYVYSFNVNISEWNENAFREGFKSWSKSNEFYECNSDDSSQKREHGVIENDNLELLNPITSNGSICCNNNGLQEGIEIIESIETSNQSYHEKNQLKDSYLAKLKKIIRPNEQNSLSEKLEKWLQVYDKAFLEKAIDSLFIQVSDRVNLKYLEKAFENKKTEMEKRMKFKEAEKSTVDIHLLTKINEENLN